MPASSSSLILAPRQTHRLFQGHTWVYRSEIGNWAGGEPENGAVVDIRDSGARFIARGLYSTASQIAVRIFTRKDVELDRAFWRERLAAAIAWREVRLPGRPCRRLVSSEGDRLPGLIVDQYRDADGGLRLVIQATTAGVDARLPMITELLTELLSPVQIIERNDLPVRKYEALPSRAGVLSGVADTAIRARVGRLDFPCDLLDPHKTGSYLDQQVNHELVADLVTPGARVLDCFSHLGGFALHALQAGAASAIAVDQAAASVAGARIAADWAGFGARLETANANAFDWLRGAEEKKERFDLVVLDPPSFTRSKDTVEGALRGYKEIHVRGLKLLKPGGLLATFTCSHHIGATAFRDMVVAAASDTGSALRLEATVGASPDHPVLPAVPESEYLKGYVFRVLGD